MYQTVYGRINVTVMYQTVYGRINVTVMYQTVYGRINDCSVRYFTGYFYITVIIKCSQLIKKKLAYKKVSWTK